jgi:HSP20 family protein
MNTIILPTASQRRVRHSESAPLSQAFRHPHYECEMRDDAVRLLVYLPGVEAAGVEIATRGPDLTVTARKRQIVRVNWQALHLERAQRPYQLHLRLGRSLDFSALEAELKDGVLTIVLPRRAAVGTDLGRPRVA